MNICGRPSFEGAIGPAQWSLEVGNRLRSGERRGRIDLAKLATWEAFRSDVQVDIVPVDIPATVRAIDLARRHELTVSAAADLDLAQVRGFGPATIDQELAGACRAERVRLISA